MLVYWERDVLAEFICPLQSRQELLAAPADALDNAIFSLSYANALLRRVALFSEQRTIPRQLVHGELLLRMR